MERFINKKGENINFHLSFKLIVELKARYPDLYFVVNVDFIKIFSYFLKNRIICSIY